MCDFKHTCPFCMHNSLRNPLSVKVSHLISENNILDKKRSTWPHCQDIQLIPNGDPSTGGQDIWFLEARESHYQHQKLKTLWI